jgi:hypothetical protein
VASFGFHFEIPKLEPAFLGFTKQGIPTLATISAVSITSPLLSNREIAVLFRMVLKQKVNLFIEGKCCLVITTRRLRNFEQFKGLHVRLRLEFREWH